MIVGACLIIALRLATRTLGAEELKDGGDFQAEPSEDAGSPSLAAKAAFEAKANSPETPAPVAMPDAGEPGKDDATPPAPPVGYQLNKPDSTFVLSKTLDEISGLSASKEPDSLWAVHDERPTLFRISTKDGEILQEIDLKRRGDYETVEEVEDKVYVGRSEGAVMVVDPVNGGEPELIDFKDRLGLACDMEGIAYEPRRKRLLLSCKNEASKSRKTRKAFEIYSLPIGLKSLHREPAYVLQEASIDDYIKAHPEQPELKGMQGKSFASSGMAVHPKTGDLYIISTRAKMLIVLGDGGALTRVDALDPAIFAQPEGIAFTADGTLFISNEAHGKRATLLGFKYVEEKGGKH